MSALFEDWFGSSTQVVVAVIDVLLVAYVNYRLLKLVRGKRAWRIVIGLLVFVIALVVSDRLQLNTLHWLLEKATVVVPIAVVILLLPELRQAFEGVGKLGGWTERLMTPPLPTSTDTVAQICAAVSDMAEHRIGALIVIERGTSVQDVAENGVTVNAKVTAPLLGALFYHGNPLHDGAVIVRGDRIISAACRLPMSDSTMIGPHYHMRHRAGVGMSEHSDAIVLIVSEERGEITTAIDGVLKVVPNDDDLRRILTRELVSTRSDTRHRRLRARRERTVPRKEVSKK